MRKTVTASIAAAAVLSLCMNVFAASTVNVKVNYAQSTVDIEYESDLNYNTDTAFYILKSGTSFSLSDTPQRIKTAPFEPGKPVSAAIRIGDDLSGEYRVYAVSGGYLSEDSTVYSDSFKIIGSTEREARLKNINGAAEAEIMKTVISELDGIADLDGESAAEWKNKYLYEIKNVDFSGAFKNISEVEKAWKLSDILKKLNDSAENEIATVINSGKDILGVSLADENEAFVKEYSRLLYILKSTGIYSLNGFKKAHEKAYAVADVNTAELTELSEVFAIHEETLEITALMNRYSKLDKTKFARNYFGYKADSAAEVRAKFLNVIENLEGSSSGGTSSGGKSTGGGSVKLPPHSEVEQINRDNNEPFSDISETHWAYRAIKALSEKNIISGYDDGCFRAENSVTRDEFVKIIVSAAGLSESASAAAEFSDVGTEHWAHKYVEIAVKNEIINGISENIFGAGLPVTRQDACVVLYRLIKNKGISLSLKDGKPVFSDADDISDYAAEAVSALSSAGIINGYENGIFDPNGKLTRAQTAKLVYLLTELM